MPGTREKNKHPKILPKRIQSWQTYRLRESKPTLYRAVTIATTKFMKLGAEVVATKLSLLKKGLHTINHYDHELNTVTHRFNTAHQQYARACKSKCFLRSTLHTVLLTNRSLYCAWVLADQVADEAFASVSVPMANLRTSPHYTHSDSVWTFRGLPYGK